MEADPSLDVVLLFRWLEEQGVRYLLIGRQAVRLYGAPVSTMDVDLWLPPEERIRFLRWLEDAQDMDLSDRADGTRPIVRAQAGLDRVDAFFVRAMTNQEGREILFESTWLAARTLHDAAEGITVRVPSIPDLIALKKMRLPNAKDEEDLRYLEVRLALEAAGRAPKD